MWAAWKRSPRNIGRTFPTTAVRGSSTWVRSPWGAAGVSRLSLSSGKHILHPPRARGVQLCVTKDVEFLRHLGQHQGCAVRAHWFVQQTEPVLDSRSCQVPTHSRQNQAPVLRQEQVCRRKKAWRGRGGGRGGSQGCSLQLGTDSGDPHPHWFFRIGQVRRGGRHFPSRGDSGSQGRWRDQACGSHCSAGRGFLAPWSHSHFMS